MSLGTESDPQMALFHTARLVHIAFCSLGMIMALLLFVAGPDNLYCSATCFLNFVNLLLAQLMVRRYARPDLRSATPFCRGV
jgi:hypothetical protein